MVSISSPNGSAGFQGMFPSCEASEAGGRSAQSIQKTALASLETENHSRASTPLNFVAKAEVDFCTKLPKAVISDLPELPPATEYLQHDPSNIFVFESLNGEDSTSCVEGIVQVNPAVQDELQEKIGQLCDDSDRAVQENISSLMTKLDNQISELGRMGARVSSTSAQLIFRFVEDHTPPQHNWSAEARALVATAVSYCDRNKESELIDLHYRMEVTNPKGYWKCVTREPQLYKDDVQAGFQLTFAKIHQRGESAGSLFPAVEPRRVENSFLPNFPLGSEVVESDVVFEYNELIQRINRLLEAQPDEGRTAAINALLEKEEIDLRVPLPRIEQDTESVFALFEGNKERILRQIALRGGSRTLFALGFERREMASYEGLVLRMPDPDLLVHRWKLLNNQRVQAGLPLENLTLTVVPGIATDDEYSEFAPGNPVVSSNAEFVHDMYSHVTNYLLLREARGFHPEVMEEWKLEVLRIKGLLNQAFEVDVIDEQERKMAMTHLSMWVDLTAAASYPIQVVNATKDLEKTLKSGRVGQDGEEWFRFLEESYGEQSTESEPELFKVLGLDQWRIVSRWLNVAEVWQEVFPTSSSLNLSN